MSASLDIAKRMAAAVTETESPTVTATDKVLGDEFI
jgi:hypothetical protein